MVTMDQIVVDCGADDSVLPGDEVVLLGRQGDETITADDWADLLGTISYEVVCGVGPRMPRILVTAPTIPVSDAVALERLRVTTSTCTKCPLAEGRTQVVFGVGSPEAELLFVGEGPGREEDLAGEPFVGRSGKLLDRLMLEEIGLPGPSATSPTSSSAGRPTTATLRPTRSRLAVRTSRNRFSSSIRR